MAYDEKLVTRLRAILARRKGVSERKMFGGVCFMWRGHMCCGVNADNLVLRLGKEGVDEAIRERHTKEMDFTGTPMSSMIYVTPRGYRADEDLKAWVERALAYVKTLTPK